MDYLEIMDYCGYDLDKSDEMARRNGAKTLPEVIEEILAEAGLERMGQDVCHVSAESGK